MVKASIVIPTFNRLGQLSRVLEALERQTISLEFFEVIVVSDGSTDGTDEYLASLSTPLRLKIVCQTNSGPAATRNNGVSNADGTIVLFIDDDVVPAPQLLAEHLHIHDESGEGLIVLGPMLTPDNFRMSPWVRWEQSKLIEQYHAMTEGHWQPTARQFYTGNSSLPRSQIIAAGGFDEHFWRAEDVDLGYRLADLGLKFVFNPNAIGYHYAERSFQSWIATPYQYGRNDVIFSLDKGQSWLIKAAARELQKRQAYTRWMVALCLKHSLAVRATVGTMRMAATIGNTLRLERVSLAAYSAIFNLRYYQGVVDELRSRRHSIKCFLKSD